MCRYACHVYKSHYVCFSCRKMFRQPVLQEMAHPVSREERVAPCPQCATPMTNMGLDFKAPRQTDIKQWRKVQELYAHGYLFSSCGCNGPGPRPATLREVKPFLAEQARLQAEQARQAGREQRVTERNQQRREKAQRVQEKRAAQLWRKLA